MSGAVADGDAASANALSFALAAGPTNDPVVSTNDVVVDPLTNDAHLVARTQSGAAAVAFRPAGGAWSAPSFVLPATFRARFVQLEGGRLALVYAKNGVGLGVRVAPAWIDVAVVGAVRENEVLHVRVVP